MAVNHNNELFENKIPQSLQDDCFQNWIYLLSSKKPSSEVFDATYLIRLNEIIDKPQEDRYEHFSMLVKEIELDGRESSLYGGNQDSSTGILTEEVDI